MSPIPNLGFWVTALVFLLGLGSIQGFRGKLKRRIPLFWGVGATVIGGIGLVGTSSQFISDYWAYLRNSVDVIEGTVHVKRRQPARVRAPSELLEIDGRNIEVEHASLESGYHKTIAYGGALTEGARVRLFVHRGRILKIEIFK